MLESRPDDLDRVALRMRTSSDYLNQLLVRITNEVALAVWQGIDASRFRSAWESEHKPAVERVAGLLLDTSIELTRASAERREAERMISYGLPVALPDVAVRSREEPD